MTSVLSELVYGRPIIRGSTLGARVSPFTPEELEKLNAEQEEIEKQQEKQRHKHMVLALAERLLLLPSEPDFEECLTRAEYIIRAAKEYLDKD